MPRATDDFRLTTIKKAPIGAFFTLQLACFSVHDHGRGHNHLRHEHDRV